MEICDIKKSVLKKPDSAASNKSKKVTFCSTVKVFIEEFNPAQKINLQDLRCDCVEINIVDKSSGETSINLDSSKIDDCNASDFLVHKVVYANETEQEDADTDTLSEDADESLVLFNTSADEEGLEFVVHKVTDHEDDLIQQELEFEARNTIGNSLDGIEINDDIVGKLSELSIENILTHDKIIAFIDQKSLGLAALLKEHVNLSKIDALSLLKAQVENTVDFPNVSGSKNSELILSPPLQELSLDKIVKAQSNNVLDELDISPLNSIQETDSESDVSSEGTMIMMTTEESEKNEQHIKESFRKYQSMQKEKSQSKDSGFASEIQATTDDEAEQTFDQKVQNVYDSFIYGTDKFISVHRNENPYSETDSVQQSIQVVPDSNTEESKPELPPKKVRSASLPNSSNANSTKNFNITCSQKERRDSFTSVKNSCYWDKSLESVQIPEDVREWKITISSLDKNLKDNLSNDSSSDSSFSENDSLISKSNMHYQSLPETYDNSCIPKVDELEKFVHASTERVQRIRKRYSNKSQKKIGFSNSVRGIKPRFCSTAEILQMLEKKTQSPFISFGHRSHVSWPCNESISSSENNIQNGDNFSHIFGSQMPKDYSSQTSFSSCISEDSNSSTCDHDSVSSCPSIFFHERGVPEGASPPRSLSNDSIERYTNDENPNNVVYFSMKV